MSRRIAYPALAIAALIATPAVAAPKSPAPAPRHGVHSMSHHRHGVHHRHGLHHRQLPAFASIVDQVATVGAPAANQAGGAVIVVNPWLQFDPSWKLCQLDPGLEDRADLCGPYSYYPYGAYGYRPFGSYRPNHDAAAHWTAPSARIIHIRSDD